MHAKWLTRRPAKAQPMRAFLFSAGRHTVLIASPAQPSTPGFGLGVVSDSASSR